MVAKDKSVAAAYGSTPDVGSGGGGISSAVVVTASVTGIAVVTGSEIMG